MLQQREGGKEDGLGASASSDNCTQEALHMMTDLRQVTSLDSPELACILGVLS